MKAIWYAAPKVGIVHRLRTAGLKATQIAGRVSVKVFPKELSPGVNVCLHYASGHHMTCWEQDQRTRLNCLFLELDCLLPSSVGIPASRGSRVHNPHLLFDSCWITSPASPVLRRLDSILLDFSASIIAWDNFHNIIFPRDFFSRVHFFPAFILKTVFTANCTIPKMAAGLPPPHKLLSECGADVVTWRGGVLHGFPF